MTALVRINRHPDTPASLTPQEGQRRLALRSHPT
jgi:hypothetical protein